MVDQENIGVPRNIFWKNGSRKGNPKISGPLSRIKIKSQQS
jgi:hypothetical protein